MTELMTVKDVARRLNVHPETVRRWLRSGRLEGEQLPTGRWGKPEYRVSEEALKRFLNHQPGKGRA